MFPRASKAAITVLIETLKDDHTYVRWSAAEALGNIGPDAKAAVPHLIEVLKNENRDVRMAAAIALGRIGSEEAKAAAISHLIEGLKDEDTGLRSSAAFALGEIATALQDRKDATAIPDLEMALVALRAGNFSEQTTRVHQALEALKAIKKVH